MVIFFILRSAGLIRYYEPSVRLLAERGHIVSVAFPHSSKAAWVAAYALPSVDVTATSNQVEDKQTMELLTRLAKAYPNFCWGYTKGSRKDSWENVVSGIRGFQDYLRYLEPAYQDLAYLRDRSVYSGIPSVAVSLMERPFLRSRLGRRLMMKILAAAERAIPVSSSVRAELLDVMPDVVLVSRLVDIASPQVDYVRAAQDLGIPVGLPVASWDNLSNKGLMRVQPDFVTVWNELQKKEAVELHRTPADRIVVTGSQTFDVWFDRKPSLDRENFFARFGFDHRRHLIAYLCSSRSIGGDEVGLVRNWLKHVRGHSDQSVREANVIVRPHPKHAEQWRSEYLDDLGPAVIFPREGIIPLNEDERSDFFDTLYHSGAIVGLNTSAQIEAAIIGRPVLVLIPDAGTGRGGTLETLHFRYLSDPEDGIASVSCSVQEHLEQLAQALKGMAPERGRRFVREFVRPHGLDRPAAPYLADAIEKGAAISTRPPSCGLFLLLLRGVLCAVRPFLSETVSRRAPKPTKRAV